MARPLPLGKLQAPKPKRQRNPKFQAPGSRPDCSETRRCRKGFRCPPACRASPAASLILNSRRQSDTWRLEPEFPLEYCSGRNSKHEPSCDNKAVGRSCCLATRPDRMKKKPAAEAAASAPANPVYEPNPKHKEPWQPGRKGTICPKDLTLHDAAKLLVESVEFNGARWAVHNGRAFKAKSHAKDRWHGWPIGWVEVPATLRQRWQRENLVHKQELKRYWSLP